MHAQPWFFPARSLYLSVPLIVRNTSFTLFLLVCNNPTVSSQFRCKVQLSFSKFSWIVQRSLFNAIACYSCTESVRILPNRGYPPGIEDRHIVWLTTSIFKIWKDSKISWRFKSKSQSEFAEALLQGIALITGSRRILSLVKNEAVQ